MPKILPKELTSYDLLKALAIILMIVDHTGHHFYPDEMWFRVIGRLCVPIWFFLIGYAQGVAIPKRLWAGALIVTASAAIAGQYIFPLSILFTIIIVRWLRAVVVIRALGSPQALRGMFLILLFLTFPTAIFFEYGAFGMMFVLVGFIVRNKDAVYEIIDHRYLKLFAFCAFFSFYMIQGVNLPYVFADQALVMLAGLIAVGLILWNFRSAYYVDSSKYISRSFVVLFQLMGRRTLEIYVAHIVVFRAIAMHLYPERYTLGAWKLFPPGFVEAFL
ncbi:MAG: TraX family protein [Alphaproteobacteria bacterium]